MRLFLGLYLDHSQQTYHLSTDSPSLISLLGLDFHWDLASFYLDSKALTKALLCVDGCQIIVAVGELGGGVISAILLP